MPSHASKSECCRWLRMGMSLAAGEERMARRTRGAVRQRIPLARRLAPEVEWLEHRQLLSTFDVTKTTDDGSTGTLRWAIAQRMPPRLPARSSSNSPVLPR